MTTTLDRKKFLKPLVFSAIVLALAFIAPALGGSPKQPGPGYVLWGTAPALVALLLRAFGKDWKDAGFRPAIKKNWRIYAALAASVPVVIAVAVGVGALLGAFDFLDCTAAKYLGAALPGIGVFLVFAFLEEVGWRGYLVPKVAGLGLNDFLAYGLVAIVWAAWHLPYVYDLPWVYNSSQPLVFVPLFFLSMYAYSAVQYEARLLAGSVWPAVAFHGFANALQHPIAADWARPRPGSEWLGSFSGILVTALVMVFGLALRRIRRLRQGDSAGIGH